MIVHPDWDGSGIHFPDIALVKSAKDFTFVKGGPRAVLPICFPYQGEKFAQ